MQTDKVFLNLTRVTIITAYIVVVLGAYTRLSDAGLGCPDWPGCYGKMIVPQHEDEVARVNQAFPERPLEHDKAWTEMVHRYAAGILGIMILIMAVIAWKRRNINQQKIWLPMILLGLVIFQALLGMWTVTLLLKPVIVMGHLLGGLTILLLLMWVLLNQMKPKHSLGQNHTPNSLYYWSVFGLLIVYLQISLGGWTSANYAALICPDFPVCQGKWWPPMNFIEGFTPWWGLGIDYEGGILGAEARTAVHVSHRIGAIITLLIVGSIAIRALLDVDPKIKLTGMVLLIVLLVQISLGIANILMFLPKPIAVAHNAVAALLLLSMGSLLFYAKYNRTD